MPGARYWTTMAPRPKIGPIFAPRSRFRPTVQPTDTSCLAAPGTVAFWGCTAEYGGARAQDMANYDLALAKRTNLAEGAKLGMRLETFNLINHRESAAPGVRCCSTPANGGSFGQIVSDISSHSTSHACCKSRPESRSSRLKATLIEGVRICIAKPAVYPCRKKH